MEISVLVAVATASKHWTFFLFFFGCRNLTVINFPPYRTVGPEDIGVGV